jgi:hypothetical protein
MVRPLSTLAQVVRTLLCLQDLVAAATLNFLPKLIGALALSRPDALATGVVRERAGARVNAPDGHIKLAERRRERKGKRFIFVETALE